MPRPSAKVFTPHGCGKIASENGACGAEGSCATASVPLGQPQTSDDHQSFVCTGWLKPETTLGIAG